MQEVPENVCAERVRLARHAKKMYQMDVAAALEELGIKANRNAIGRIKKGTVLSQSLARSKKCPIPSKLSS